MARRRFPSLLIFALLTAACGPAQEPTSGTETDPGTPPGIPTAPASSTQVVLLGTGTPEADPLRSGPSVAIVVNDGAYLVDFGPGVVRQAAAAEFSGVWAVNVLNLGTAFLTHLHSDHTTGYPDLILTPWVLGRDDPLEVFGPDGLQEMTDNILEAYSRDIELRTSGLEEATDAYRPIVHEIDPGIVYQDDNVTVEAFLVNHGSWPQAFGYKFTTPDKTIVISGDTAPSESIVERCNGCDILVHEVYSLAGFEFRPPDWQQYHSSFHTSSAELAELASRARPGLLILYHQLFWGTMPEELVAEVRAAGYDGEVVSGKDLDVF